MGACWGDGDSLPQLAPVDHEAEGNDLMIWTGGEQGPIKQLSAKPSQYCSCARACAIMTMRFHNPRTGLTRVSTMYVHDMHGIPHTGIHVAT